MAELNELIADADALDDGRVITGRPLTVAAAFAAEAAQLRACQMACVTSYLD